MEEEHDNIQVEVLFSQNIHQGSGMAKWHWSKEMRDRLQDVLLALYPYKWYIRDSEISESLSLSRKLRWTLEGLPGSFW